MEAKQLIKDHFLNLAGPDPEDEPPSPEVSPTIQFISTHDTYWEFFFNKPQSAADIFTIITKADIRYVRDANRTNFLTFIRVLVDRIVTIPKISGFTKNLNDVKVLLNSIRFLTLLLPVLYEEENDDLKSLFWSTSFGLEEIKFRNFSNDSNQATVGTYSSSTTNSELTNSSLKPNIDAKILYSPQSLNVNINQSKVDCMGVQLIKVLIELLFWRDFTLETNEKEGQLTSDLKITEGFDLKIWEVGIGMNGKYSVPNPKIDSTRLEILRLIITLSSNELYVTSNEIVSNGSRFLSILVSTLPRLKFLTFICSLLNLICRSIKVNEDINGLKYTGSISQNKNVRKELATNCLHLLTIMLVYPLPANDIKFLSDLNIFPVSSDYQKPINLVRSYLGKLHKENELNFIYQSIFQFLNKPIESAIENEASPFNLLTQKANPSNNYLPQLSSWSTEVVMLLWEFIQCNKNFKKFIISKKSNELMITLLYYLKYYKSQPKLRMNLIRVISFLFLYLTADESILKKSLLPFNNNYYLTKIPSFYRLSNHQNSINLAYRDFLIISISNILTNLNEFDDLLTPTFFECLYNLIPINSKGEDLKIKATLSYHSCLAIMNVVSTYAASSQILLKDPLKLDLFTLLLRSITNSICRYFKESRTLMYLILKHEQLFQNLLKLLEDYKIESESENLIDDNSDIQPYTPSLAPSSVPGNTPQIGTPQQPSTPVNERSEPDYNSNTPDDRTQDGDTDDDSNLEVDEFGECLRPKLPVGMSVKAKSKLPMDVPLIKNWSGYKSLTILLKLIKLINEQLKLDLNSSTSSKFEIMEILIKIENLKPLLDTQFFIYLPSEFKHDFEPLKFHWSELSLGWYSSILWSEIYLSNNIISLQAIEQQASLNSANWFSRKSSSYSIKDVASSWGFHWRTQNSNSSPAPNPKNLYATTLANSEALNDQFVFDIGLLTLNIWHGTSVKLFKIRKDSNNQVNALSDLMKKFKIITDNTTTNNTNNNNNNNNNNPHNGSTGSLNSQGVNPNRLSISGTSPYTLTPINSRQSFGTPRNSIAGPPTGVGLNELSRISSRHSLISNHD